ncbi:hypothetical protein [Actinomadura madurae]|uniref:hypothetical protein n=1 Tax=Actinomadura madurae TaxID=1993 RepID=UPI0020D215AC|nr:hypothetical protein [Actinomadura madurae]MCP9949469.1 hypothetical protein [Actinomadura madurae]MCP9978713.1 hypothetical protein [Actinomadura madurae]MCQ0009767.1 hypothetical protein [Actinomadura madurae]
MSEMPVVPGAVGPMWSTVRRLAGYGAAASLSLYLAVKIVWVVVALLGHAPAGFGDADWIVLNTVTVGMSATGVALGLVLAHGRRWRTPAAPLVVLAWTGSGFLIPLLPYGLLSALLGAAGVKTGGDDGDSGGDAAPSWELLLIGIGFTGMAVGLAVALPIYMRERWRPPSSDASPTASRRPHVACAPSPPSPSYRPFSGRTGRWAGRAAWTRHTTTSSTSTPGS